MSLNDFMHPRNIYKTAPDFKLLVEDYPEIRQHMTTDLSGRTRFNFAEPAALRVLTRTLLQRDFQLEVTIPPERLVPTLPNRLNYLLWLEDILQQAIRLPEGETPRALDVGAGACAVYCLLGARRGWQMVGTEQDPEALAVARDNVAANQLQNHVQVLAADDTLLLGPLETAGAVHFTLCNPPFYDSENPDEGAEARAHRPPPPAASSGLRHEVSCPGGERAFVQRMISESAQLQHRCCVFSTMLGHKSSVRPLKKAAYEAGARQVINSELCQGFTKRWAIAWTFRADLPLKDVSAMKQVKKRPPLQCLVPRNMEGIPYNVPELKQHVVAWLEELQATVEPGNCNKYFASYKVTAMENTWTHARRRRRAQQRTKVATSAASPSAEVTSDLEQSPASADLGSPDPDRSADLSATSTVSGTSPEAGQQAAGDPGLKRSRTDTAAEGEDATVTEDPIAKRPCLETQLDAVSLEDDAAKSDSRRRRPALVFTLFVQKKGADILLLLAQLAGQLRTDGLNGVLLHLRNQMQMRVQTQSSTQRQQQPARIREPPQPRLVEGMGRLLGHLRDGMRSKLCLEAPLGRASVAAAAAAEAAAAEAVPEPQQQGTREESVTEPAAEATTV